jgi:hypothetical protein
METSLTGSGSKRFYIPFAILTAAAITLDCGNSSSSPSNGSLVSSVTLSATSVPAGSTSAGSVALTSAAPSGGVTIALASSNPAVATVPATMTVPSGAASAAITVSAVAAGTATISASLNGTTRVSPMLTVTGQPVPVLTSLSLAPATVVGGEFVRGTVVLSAVAPPGGAVVSLVAGDPVSVPANVTVPAGLSNATFSVVTKPVATPATVNVQATYGSSSATAPLTVTPPFSAVARFGVSGPTETETCTLANNGGTLNCTFNGATSTAPGRITAFDWTYGLATTFTQTTTSPVLTRPDINCSMLPPPPLPNGAQWFTMTVTLTVRDDQGNVSAKAVNDGVRLIPKDSCGF